MASGLTLDTGALIAAEKNSRRFWTIWHEAVEREVAITVPAVVLAQAWRGNCPVIARVLKACAIDELDAIAAKGTGLLLEKTSTRDVVDAAVVFGAASRGDAVVTSDFHDIQRLAGKAWGRITIISV